MHFRSSRLAHNILTAFIFTALHRSTTMISHPYTAAYFVSSCALSMRIHASCLRRIGRTILQPLHSDVASLSQLLGYRPSFPSWKHHLFFSTANSFTRKPHLICYTSLTPQVFYDTDALNNKWFNMCPLFLLRLVS